MSETTQDAARGETETRGLGLAELVARARAHVAACEAHIRCECVGRCEHYRESMVTESELASFIHREGWFTLARQAAALAALTQRAEAVDAALLEACPDNTARAVGEPEEDVGRYLVLNTDGAPIIEANDPADAIRQMRAAWDRLGEGYEKLVCEHASLRQRAETAERALDEAVQWIGVVRDELVIAGYPGGDRTVALRNLRALISGRYATGDENWTQMSAEGEADAERAAALLADRCDAIYVARFAKPFVADGDEGWCIWYLRAARARPAGQSA